MASVQLLISAAADRAAEHLKLNLPDGPKVFVDITSFEGDDGTYAIGAIRANLLKHGVRLVDTKSAPDMIVEVRAAALSTDEADTLVSIPSFNIPIPLAGPLPTPKLALFERHTENGVAIFAATSHDSREGGVVESANAGFGRSVASTSIVLFFTWTNNDAVPRAA